MIITTSTGKHLNDEYGSCKSLKEYAIRKGLQSVQVWFCEEDGTYLITYRDEPNFVSSNFEAIAAHIDIMAIVSRSIGINYD